MRTIVLLRVQSLTQKQVSTRIRYFSSSISLIDLRFLGPNVQPDGKLNDALNFTQFQETNLDHLKTLNKSIDENSRKRKHCQIMRKRTSNLKKLYEQIRSSLKLRPDMSQKQTLECVFDYIQNSQDRLSTEKRMNQILTADNEDLRNRNKICRACIGDSYNSTK